MIQSKPNETTERDNWPVRFMYLESVLDMVVP